MTNYFHKPGYYRNTKSSNLLILLPEENGIVKMEYYNNKWLYVEIDDVTLIMINAVHEFEYLGDL